MVNKNAKGIAVAGSIMVEKTPDPLHSGLNRLSCTGCVPNIAMMLKKLSPGMPVSVIGRVGDDAEGRYAVQRLRAAGMEASGLKLIAGEQTGCKQGNFHSGALQNFGITDMVFRDLSCKILHLGYFLMLNKIDDGDGRKILKHARRCGIETSLSMLSGCSERYTAVLAALPHTDYLIVSLEDAGKLADMVPDSENLQKIARKLIWHGVKKKVFIHSPDWLVCCSRTQYCLLGNYILPEDCACCDEQVADAFCAGVLTGVNNGWSDMKILEFASSCAAVKQCREEEAESVRDVEAYCQQFKRHKKVL